MTERYVEGPWLCKECWESDGDCDCYYPQPAQTWFKEDWDSEDD